MTVLAPAPDAREFYPITSRLVSDRTETWCEECEFREDGHAGLIAHGAAHAISTGHTVHERHARDTVFTGHPS